MEKQFIMAKNKWNTMNGIWVKGTITDMLNEGKSKQEVVDFFYGAVISCKNYV